MKRNFSIQRFITRRRDVIYSKIANFENYVNFVPGCSSAQLIEKNDDFEIGKLEFNFLIRNYSIKSKNVLSENSIEILQIEGPFDYFKGEWTIKKFGPESSEVNFHAEFELPFLLDNLLPDKAIEAFFDKAIKGFIDELVNKKEG